jgi:hypothetical protein
MNHSARYVKIVEWSDEDQCFVGQCPGIIGPCYHGLMKHKSMQSFVRLLMSGEPRKRDGKPLPPRTAAKDLAKKLSDAA